MMFRTTSRLAAFLAGFFLACAAGHSVAAEGLMGLPPAKADGGELRYVDGLPVLIVGGTPEEIGRQTAALTAPAVEPISNLPWLLVVLTGRGQEWSTHLARAQSLLTAIPESHRQEVDAFVQRSGIGIDKMASLNTLLDVYGGFGCSSVIVEPGRSASGEVLFGRNVDFPPTGVLQHYSLVVVCRPKGKYAFATVGFPGLFGAFSGMNEHGLALSVHGVFTPRAGAAPFDPKGTPCTFLCRTVLEQCKTIEEAEKFLGSAEYTTALNLVLCDRSKGTVVEAAPDGVAIRRSEQDLCTCTNHFRAGKRLRDDVCPRYARLRQMPGRATLKDVASKLNEVNQGAQTLQTMVFEPKALRLHLAAGSCPSSALPLKTLELGPLFAIDLPASDRPSH